MLGMKFHRRKITKKGWVPDRPEVSHVMLHRAFLISLPVWCREQIHWKRGLPSPHWCEHLLKVQWNRKLNPKPFSQGMEGLSQGRKRDHIRIKADALLQIKLDRLGRSIFHLLETTPQLKGTAPLQLSHIIAPCQCSQPAVGAHLVWAVIVDFVLKQIQSLVH